MTKRTYTLEKKNPQHNQEWSWEETPELADWIKSQTNSKIVPPNRPNDKS
tara:strand:- start:1006 stop:1155 length:150 start_codon:yes stop_codon:yes gene_type:complete